MTKRDVELRLKKAVKADTPNVLDNVLSQCEKQAQGERKVISMKKNNKVIKGLIAAAAAFAIIIGGAVAVTSINNINKAEQSVVTLDVNPSLEISLNAKEKVLGVKPLNDDGKKVVGNMDFKNSSLEVTVNALIGSMVREGYINELANSILVSVNSRNSQKGAELEQKLSKDIENLLKTDKFSGAVLSQVVERDDEIEDKAEQYGITVGKASLIEKIIKVNSLYTFEQLVPLSINELNLLIQSNSVNQNAEKEVFSVGNASEQKYIGKGKAEQIALNHAGFQKGKVTELETELDFENGQMIYEIEFKADGNEYDYDISAVDGSIIKSQKEQDDIDGDGDDEIPPENNKFISKQAAKQTAFSHANVSGANCKEIEAELEKDNGVWIYQVDFKFGGYEYDYEIDAASGKILKSEKEADN